MSTTAGVGIIRSEMMSNPAPATYLKGWMMAKRLEDLVVDGEQIGVSWVMRKPRRKPKKREFMVIMTRAGWVECPLCELQLGSSKLLIKHLRQGCDVST